MKSPGGRREGGCIAKASAPEHRASGQISHGLTPTGVPDCFIMEWLVITLAANFIFQLWKYVLMPTWLQYQAQHSAVSGPFPAPQCSVLRGLISAVKVQSPTDLTLQTIFDFCGPVSWST